MDIDAAIHQDIDFNELMNYRTVTASTPTAFFYKNSTWPRLFPERTPTSNEQAELQEKLNDYAKELEPILASISQNQQGSNATTQTFFTEEEPSIHHLPAALVPVLPHLLKDAERALEKNDLRGAVVNAKMLDLLLKLSLSAHFSYTELD